MANWSQLPPQTPKSHKAISTKTSVCLLLHANITVTKNPKLISDKPTGVPLRKTQKVVHMARKCGIDPMLLDNILVLRYVLLLLACSPLLSFSTMISSLPLCIQCLKLAPDVMICSKQTEYYACDRYNRFYKPCLEV